MGYYQGDLYRGDFFGSVGKIFSAGKRLLSPLIHPSNAAGAVEKAISTAYTYGRKAPAEIMGAARAHPVIAAAGAATAAAAGLGAMHAGGARPIMSAAGMGGGGGMRGFHISKKTGNLVRNRRMRATNPKALRRALRRAYAFERIAMRTIHLVHPRKKGRFGGFRRHRRKAA